MLIAHHFGRYIVTMMTTGVILLIDFSGYGQMNALIWYSWVGGIIIGTMISSNMVLDEVSRDGPRNVVITGRLQIEQEAWKRFAAAPN
ncbi:hypothetical protein CTI12_AA259440 [Artemisia annua]|uniref:Uncharacterized protein n=1 Tax=Artemisia annua TaxID=35608 RepID=A0A2U1NJH9_ARTAN|nr:hypothetical protein CTI12_AA259440 [Artemisia annua]